MTPAHPLAPAGARSPGHRPTRPAAKRRARIALVVPGLMYGGGLLTVTRFLYDVVAARSDYQVDVISLALSAVDGDSLRLARPDRWLRGPAITDRESEGMPYRHVGAVFPEWETLRYAPRRALSRLLDDSDLIQVVGGTPAWAMPVLGCGKPVCLCAATMAEVERQAVLRTGGWPRRAWRGRMTGAVGRMDRKALRAVDAVFVINRWMEEHAGQIAGPSRVVFAPPGVDTDFFTPGEYCPDGPIVSVARFGDPRKNVRLLFQAYAELSRSLKTVPDLVLAGLTGPSAADWAHADQLGIASRVHMKQGISLAELRDLYRKASLFLLSSEEEGLGIVILEAMASGLPVVATRCGGPETIIADGENGYLTPVGDAAALAAPAQRLLTDPALCRRVRSRARRHVEETFSLAVAGRRFLDRYEQLLA